VVAPAPARSPIRPERSALLAAQTRRPTASTSCARRWSVQGRRRRHRGEQLVESLRPPCRVRAVDLTRTSISRRRGLVEWPRAILSPRFGRRLLVRVTVSLRPPIRLERAATLVARGGQLPHDKGRLAPTRRRRRPLRRAAGGCIIQVRFESRSCVQYMHARRPGLQVLASKEIGAHKARTLRGGGRDRPARRHLSPRPKLKPHLAGAHGVACRALQAPRSPRELKRRATRPGRASAAARRSPATRFATGSLATLKSPNGAKAVRSVPPYRTGSGNSFYTGGHIDLWRIAFRRQFAVLAKRLV